MSNLCFTAYHLNLSSLAGVWVKELKLCFLATVESLITSSSETKPFKVWSFIRSSMWCIGSVALEILYFIYVGPLVCDLSPRSMQRVAQLRVIHGQKQITKSPSWCGRSVLLSPSASTLHGAINPQVFGLPYRITNLFTLKKEKYRRAHGSVNSITANSNIEAGHL